MKKISAIIISIIFIICISAGGGYYLCWKDYNNKPLVIEQEKIVYQVVNRPYTDLTFQDAVDELKKYDISEPTLEIIPIGKRKIKATASLYKRQWSREAKVQVGSSGNWKLYVGIGIGTVCTAGAIYGLSRIIK